MDKARQTNGLIVVLRTCSSLSPARFAIHRMILQVSIHTSSGTGRFSTSISGKDINSRGGYVLVQAWVAPKPLPDWDIPHPSHFAVSPRRPPANPVPSCCSTKRRPHLQPACFPGVSADELAAGFLGLNLSRALSLRRILRPAVFRPSSIRPSSTPQNRLLCLSPPIRTSYFSDSV